MKKHIEKNHDKPPHTCGKPEDSEEMDAEDSVSETADTETEEIQENQDLNPVKERSRRGQYGSRQKLPSKKKNQQKKSELENSFICQDVVLGEFSCSKCKYTTFKKWQMLTHIKKKHPTQSTGPSSPANVPEKISTELPNSKQCEKPEKSEKPENETENPENETESPMEIGAWPKFPSTEIILSFEIPTPISPIPDLEKINDDPIQETAKQAPNSMPLLTVEKKTEHKNGQVNETFVLPKEEKIPIETKVLSKTPEYPPLNEKAKPINLTPISGLEQLNVDLMQLKQVRPVRMNATITPPQVSKDRRVSFRENVVCQEYSPKENPKLVINLKKSTSKLLSTPKLLNTSKLEKTPKSGLPKPWKPYDGTEMVNQLLGQSRQTDTNNNPKAIFNENLSI